MVTASPDIDQSVNLTNRESRVRFLTEILSRESAISQRLHSCPDYSQSIGRLAEAFSDIIGDRRGPYRDQEEQSAVVQRLSDAGWGFLYGAKSAPPNNRMLQSWVTTVVEAMSANFRV